MTSYHIIKNSRFISSTHRKKLYNIVFKANNAAETIKLKNKNNTAVCPRCKSPLLSPEANYCSICGEKQE